MTLERQGPVEYGRALGKLKGNERALIPLYPLDQLLEIPDLLPLHSLHDRAVEVGLPFSKYDREDLEALQPDQLAAIARLLDLRPPASVDAVLRAGQRVYNWYQKNNPGSAVALLQPMLLTAIARAAAARSPG